MAVSADGVPVRWQERAACADRTADMFPGPNDQLGFRRARAICALCPVIVECAELRDRVKPQAGVWAGKTMRIRSGT